MKRIDFRAPILLATVLAVLAASLRIPKTASFSVLLALLSVPSLMLLFQKPRWGLPGLLVASLCLPLSFGTGTQSSLHLAILMIPLLAAVWTVDMLRQKAAVLTAGQINLPVLAFVTSVTISTLAGNIPWNYFAEQASLRAQLGGWMIFVFSPVVLLLVGNLVQDVRQLETITWLFLAVGAVVMASRLVPNGAVVGDHLVVAGATGSLFWVWLTALAGGQLLFNQSLGWFGRLMLTCLVLMTLGTGWFLARTWVSGWLPASVALVVLMGLRSWRLGLLLIVAMLLGVLLFAPEVLATVISTDQYSIDTREVAWEILINQVLPANPILGLGPANYYHHARLYAIMGYFVEFSSHNQYVDILAQTGILGLAAFAWLMTAIGRVGWKLREQCPAGFARGYVYGCLGGLAGTLVAGTLGDWFLPFVYNVGLTGFRASVLGWLFLGGLIALDSIDHLQSQAT